MSYGLRQLKFGLVGTSRADICCQTARWSGPSICRRRGMRSVLHHPEAIDSLTEILELLAQGFGRLGDDTGNELVVQR